MTGSDDEPGKLTDSQLDVLSPDADGAGRAPGDGPSPAGAAALAAWRDAGRPAEERVADLLGRMTLAEKVGQLRSTWPGHTPDGAGASADGGSGGVAPLQDEMGAPPAEWPELIRDGLGQLTRPFGTTPVTAREGAESLALAQRQIAGASRFGIPAIAHDECLAGFTAWTATIFPIPLAWGASFDPPLVEQMAAHIGASMRAVGVHQGLAPVLDVTVDPRWGRTEETIGEDPYLVATVGTAYVRGLESAGLICTLKHFVGYSASRGGRNLAPSAVTSRQLTDLLLPPFEMAIRLGGARSVMHAYTEIDGIPTAADPYLLSEVLREDWDFTGTVVADYFGISFLELLHRVAASPADAAALALAAGVDVELPAVRCFGPPLIDAVGRGQVDEALVDRAARRVLLQKCELGLLDQGWDPDPGPAEVDLDPPSARELAARLAEESIVLLSNDGILPLAGPGKIAVVGPRADDPLAMLGCYSFPSHVGVRYPDLGLGVEIPTVLAALRAELPDSQVTFHQGCGVDDPDTSGIEAAAELAAESDLCIAVLGDQSGLFGRGTSGEGCDAPDLNLPGVQGELLTALLATGTPVVLVLLAGRPYALGPFTAAAVVQAFFPGQRGGPALAGILSGAVNPSGRLPVSVPRHAGAQPATYLGPVLSHRTSVSAIDPDALYPFGHGLTYTSFRWTDVSGPAPAQVPTDGAITVGLTVTNVGQRAGTEVVQVYLHDPVAQVTRPTVLLVGYARLDLEPGSSRRVEFAFHTDLLSFTGRSGQRVVEPGPIELRLGRSSTDIAAVVPVELTGPERTIRGPRTMTAEVRVENA
ncbi:MAG TPA: glycoside hydrolase family 3 N-terminal domain-containing protein [Trebonia sp.]|jgi:beta-xylosidase|nr:glycoside hydrolase family 3 N-terminal domain-containing protein [Trebonia sp.]